MAKIENPISALGRLVAGLAQRSKTRPSAATDAAKPASLKTLFPVPGEPTPTTVPVSPLTPSEIAAANEARWDRLKAALGAELPDMAAAGLSHDDSVRALRLLCGAEIREVETALVQAALASGRLLGTPSPGEVMDVCHRQVEAFVVEFAGQVRRRHGLGEFPPGRRFGPERP